MFTKLYISHIVSCNWSQTLKFEHIITRSNPYTAQFWTPPYVNHNIEKHQVILAIIIKKHVFSILYLVGIKHVIRCVLHCRATFQQYYLKRLLPKTNTNECSAHWLGWSGFESPSLNTPLFFSKFTSTVWSSITNI